MFDLVVQVAMVDEPVATGDFNADEMMWW